MRTATKAPRADDKRFGFKQEKWKHPEPLRDRVRELAALGCTDTDIARLTLYKVTPECVRGILVAMGVPVTLKQKTVFSGSCVKCGSESRPDSPICRGCFDRLKPIIRERINMAVRFKTRIVAEKKALEYLNALEAK